MIRRDILKFSSGAAAGLVFTPIPWRLLGDSAIWTQNWPWMPRVPRGEVSEKNARCTLCPAACAVKVRCTGSTPTGLWPRQSAMCPAGFVAHHLAWHPMRLRQTLHGQAPASVDAALAAASKAARPGATAVLDLLPGRTASLLHRAALAKLGGLYLTPPPIEGATAAVTASLLAQPAPLAAELQQTKTLLSLSTPLLDGWAAPERSINPPYTLIQAETRRSRTAGLAGEWLPIRAGSEPALLLGLAHCLLRRSGALQPLPGFSELAAAAAQMPPAAAAEHTGIEAARLEALASRLASTPSLILADGDPIGGPLGAETQALAAALNILTGLQGFRRRLAVPAPKDWPATAETPLSSAPDGSLALLIIDEPLPGLGLPWALIQPKLAPNATVIALTWNQASWASHAQWLVPVPAFLEAPQDAPPACDTAQSCFAVAPALLPPAPGTIHAAEFVARLAGDQTPFADRLKERIQALGADEKELLENGGCWSAPAAPAPPGPPRRLLPDGVLSGQLVAAASRPPESLQVVGYGWRHAAVSPLLGKLWQESELRPSPRDAAIHPETLRAFNLAAGNSAVVQAAGGRLPVRLAPDPNLPPGMVALSSGPAFSQLCRPDSSGAWRVPGAKVVPA
jgi:hypothetical protein